MAIFGVMKRIGKAKFCNYNFTIDLSTIAIPFLIYFDYNID